MKENKNEKETGKVNIPEDLKKILRENSAGDGVAWKIIRNIKADAYVQKNDKLVAMYGTNAMLRMFKEGMKYADSPEKRLLDAITKKKNEEGA